MYSTSSGENTLLHYESTSSDVCLTIICRTFLYWPDRKSNRLRLKEAIEKGKLMLRQKVAHDDFLKLSADLDNLFASVDFTSNGQGIGLYISSAMSRIVHFHFPVDDQIIVGQRFGLKELVSQNFYTVPYFVLFLSRKTVSLYRGSFNKLTRITDEYFPRQYDDDYIYNPPTHSSSFMGRSVLKQFEGDKNEVVKKHITDFFKGADDSLAPYMADNMQLVLVGVRENIELFKKITAHYKNVAGEVPGNYDYAPLAEWGQLTWNVILTAFDNSKKQHIQTFRERIGNNLTAWGSEPVKAAVGGGNCSVLLVEEGQFSPSASTTNVDEISALISAALRHRATIVPVENGSLEEFQRLALITRYPVSS